MSSFSESDPEELPWQQSPQQPVPSRGDFDPSASPSSRGSSARDVASKTVCVEEGGLDEALEWVVDETWESGRDAESSKEEEEELKQESSKSGFSKLRLLELIAAKEKRIPWKNGDWRKSRGNVKRRPEKEMILELSKWLKKSPSIFSLKKSGLNKKTKTAHSMN